MYIESNANRAEAHITCKHGFAAQYIGLEIPIKRKRKQLKVKE